MAGQARLVVSEANVVLEIGRKRRCLVLVARVAAQARQQLQERVVRCRIGQHLQKRRVVSATIAAAAGAVGITHDVSLNLSAVAHLHTRHTRRAAVSALLVQDLGHGCVGDDLRAVRLQGEIQAGGGTTTTREELQQQEDAVPWQRWRWRWTLHPCRPRCSSTRPAKVTKAAPQPNGPPVAERDSSVARAPFSLRPRP